MIEVRRCRVSADWTMRKDGTPGSSKTTLTYWRVLVDGRIVDSFLDQKRAEARAAELRGEDAA
jgi:hypothetical protein